MSQVSDVELDPVVEMLEMDPATLGFDPQITLTMSLSWVQGMTWILKKSGSEVAAETGELCEQQVREQLRAMVRAVDPQVVAELLELLALEEAELATNATLSLSPVSGREIDLTCKLVDQLAEKQVQWAVHKALLWTATQRPSNGVSQ
jgi:hypothetical protein